MNVVVAAVALLFLVVGAAQAQPPLPSRFSSAGKAGNIIDVHLRKHGRSLVTTGREGRCGGRVDGRARVLSARVVTITRTHEDFPTCVLRITFSPNYSRARIAQTNCTAWHGASCDFVGILRRQN